MQLIMLRRAGVAIWGGVKGVVRSIGMPLSLHRVNGRLAKSATDRTAINKLTESDLKALVESEWTRAKELDEKLQKLTAALSVAVTVGGLVGATMLQDLAASGWKLTAALLFALAVLLLIAGVAIGFKGLQPKQRYGYGAEFLVIMAAGGENARNELIAAAAAFQRDNQIRANEAIAATVSIRNGIFFFVLAVLVGLGAAALGKAPPPDRAPSSLAVTCFI